jgi:C1A family cysteine protease
MTQHVYNWRPTPFTPQDKLYKPSLYRKLVALPPATDLRGGMLPVVDQGQLGSCTACGIVSGLREFLVLKNGGVLPDRLSRLFLYWEERYVEGDVADDQGAQIGDGMQVLVDDGVCPEALYPYDITNFRATPTDTAVRAAKAYAIKTPIRIQGLQNVKQVLASGYPVVAGMDVYQQMESDEAATTGIVRVPKMLEESLGGHCVCVVGYVDTPRGPGYWKGGGKLIVRNSWGTGWGDHGYFRIAYAYVTGGYMNEFWTAQV